MGDHTHDKREFVFSCRYVRMEIDGMHSGDDPVSSAEVFAADGGYTVTPENMTMDMHMLGIMYALTDKLTLMLMANYIETGMDHRINLGAPMMLFDVVGGQTFTTESSGWGDARLSALYQFFEGESSSAHAGLGMSFATGSINEEDNTPRRGMSPTFPVQQLPAPMQLGSGTHDLLPSLTYLHSYEDWAFGAQANGVIRLEDENDNGYRLGHVFELIGWAGYDFNNSIGINGGLSYKKTGKLKGTQADIDLIGPAGRSVTTAFADNYGGERIDVLLGSNFIFQDGFAKGHRLAVDFRLPLWQDLNGYQLETDSVLTIGWQKAF